MIFMGFSRHISGMLACVFSLNFLKVRILLSLNKIYSFVFHLKAHITVRCVVLCITLRKSTCILLLPPPGTLPFAKLHLRSTPIYTLYYCSHQFCSFMLMASNV